MNNPLRPNALAACREAIDRFQSNDGWQFADKEARDKWMFAAGINHLRDELEKDGPEFTDSARAALLWVLWHHQGASSDVGQPIRFALGMGQYDRMTDTQVAEARQWGSAK